MKEPIKTPPVSLGSFLFLASDNAWIVDSHKLKPAVRSYLEKEAAGKAAVAPALPRPGTRLVRQWRGTTYEVIILPDGVLLDGVHLSSLTEAAYKITGAKWSGPRFFGLVKGGRNGGNKTT